MQYTNRKADLPERRRSKGIQAPIIFAGTRFSQPSEQTYPDMPLEIRTETLTTYGADIYMKNLLIRIVLVSTMTAFVAAHSSPRFETADLGTGGVSQAGYTGSGDVYSLTGKGMGVYWCLDDAGFAYLKDENTSGDFTFTVRLKMRPTVHAADGSIGIMVKARRETHAPVAALRWDYYHATRSLTGLGWFNRITPSDSIDPNCGSCRKGCTDYSEFPCYGYAFEGLVPGFNGISDTPIWMQVIRKKREGRSRYYFLVRHDSETEYRLVRPLTADKTPCGEYISPYLLPYFTVPEEPADGAVSVGIYVAGSLKSGDDLTAQFDNITFTPSCEVPSMGCLDDDMPAE